MNIRVLVLVVAASCGGKKEGGGGGGGGGGDWTWKLAPATHEVAYGPGKMQIKGDLPTGWDSKTSMGGVRLAMPEKDGMINASINIAPLMSANKAKEAAADPVDPSYKQVDAPKEIVPGRWSRVLLEPGGLSGDRVSYDAAVFWDVGAATIRCAVRIVGPKDNPAVWGQALDTCKSVQVTLPEQK